MITEFVIAWENRKRDLKKYFAETEQSEYDSYEKLVAAIFRLVINPEVKEAYNINAIHVIDDGDYQGTLLFLVPLDTYQPCASEYVLTWVFYGSCSGCDTLLEISNYADGKPTDEQVREYMILCLHLLQNMRYLMEDGE